MKKTFRALRLGAILLAACLTLTLPAQAAARYPEKEHLPVDFADMEYTGYDGAALRSALSALEQIAASPAAQTEDAEIRAALEALYGRILSEVDQLSTQSALIGIRYDANGADQEAADESAALSQLSVQLFDECYRTLGLLADTPYRDILERDAGPEILDELRNYQALTAREAALYEEEERLVQAYDQAMAQPVQAVREGQVWTEESLAQDRELDDETWWEISAQLERERNRAAGEIFLQLVRVRTEIAKENGYDSYADYAYRESYGRDYTTEDIEAVRRAAKRYWVPLEARLMDALSQRDLRALDVRTRAYGDDILDAVEPYMARIDPELAETFAFMRQYHLYDIAPSDSKLPVGYTVGLPAYGTAFIFDDPYGDHQDYSTVIHEFGHFNETFHSAEHDLWSSFHIDVGEIHSQGLEVLFTAYAGEMFGPEGGRAFYWATISNMVSSVLEGCMYDEFQTAVYEVNRLFKDISEEYGYSYEGDGEESYFWVEITHNFQSPMYYISYATSALSALDLWLISLEDWDTAVDIYLDLAAMGLSQPYRETVEAVGLRDIFHERTMRLLADGIQDRLSEETGERGSWELPVVLLGAGFGGAVILIAAGALLVCRRRRRAAALAQAAETPWELP